MHTPDDQLEYRPAANGRHRPYCTCGEWVHPHDIDITSERERLEVEAVWAEHHLTGLRG